MEPEIIIFDEPDAGLDTTSKTNFYNLIKMLNKEKGTTIIFITHNLDDVIEYANKVIVLNEGKLLKVGKPYEVLSNEEIMNKASLDMPYAIDIYNTLKSKAYNLDLSKLRFDELYNQMLHIN